MRSGNETPTITCRFLDESYFEVLLRKFQEAFSDYAHPPKLDLERFRSHLVLNAVDLDRSVGCFEGGEMIGFSLNGFGQWNGRSTVYDAGTGVIPTRRRRGASQAMFDLQIPRFRADGIEQYLLEVITSNDPAVSLYKKLGFRTQRELFFMEAGGPLVPESQTNVTVDIRVLSAADLVGLSKLWCAGPSWQNSNEAVARSGSSRRILGAFLDGQCVGYVAYTTGMGRIAQFAVDTDHRRKGIGSRLLAEMESELTPGEKMQVINVDDRLPETVRFFEKRGFRIALTQYEMILSLHDGAI